MEVNEKVTANIFRVFVNKEGELDMTDERYNALMKSNTLSLTEVEIAAGWHYCIDWDFLLVGPEMPEFAVSECAKYCCESKN